MSTINVKSSSNIEVEREKKILIIFGSSVAVSIRVQQVYWH